MIKLIEIIGLKKEIAILKMPLTKSPLSSDIQVYELIIMEVKMHIQLFLAKNKEVIIK
jgi:hypothetical protein